MSNRLHRMISYYKREETDTESASTQPLHPPPFHPSILFPPSAAPSVIVLPVASPTREERSQTPRCGDDRKENDESERRSWVTGTALVVTAAAVQYRLMNAWIKYRRVCRDQHECLRVAREEPAHAALAYGVHDHLREYRTNRAWSLLNHSLLLAGAGTGAAACLLPRKSLALVALSLGTVTLLSGATRCSLWYSQIHDRRQRMLALDQQAKTVVHCVFPEPSAPPPPPPPEYCEF